MSAKAEAATQRAAFLDALKHARATQETVFQQCVRANAATVFGREHGFADATDLAAYKRTVPIRGYEALEPWLSRATAGEPAVLTVEAPIGFSKTTGSTGANKAIPITPTSDRWRRNSSRAYLGTLFEYYPAAGERDDAIAWLQFSPKPVTSWFGEVPFFTSTQAPPHLSVVEHHAPWFHAMTSLPNDDSERLYFLLCYAALHDLVGFHCLHPSRIQTVITMLDTAWPRLVKELHDGTLLGEPRRAPAVARAAELEAIARRTGTLLPRDVWPTLAYVSSWSGSYISLYRERIERAFCAGFMPCMCASTEAFHTVPIDDDPIGQPLDIRFAMTEFIPEWETARDGVATLTFEELELGAVYEIVITTPSGLYRYAMGDQYRVVGFVDGVPRLEFLGRRATSDMTGEKVTEAQVSEALVAVLAACALRATNFTACAINETAQGKPPYYVFVFEPAATWDAPAIDQLTARLDAELRRMNPRYELKRGFGDLGRGHVETVSPGTFARYRKTLEAAGMPAGRIKDKFLHNDGVKILAELRRLSSS